MNMINRKVIIMLVTLTLTFDLKSYFSILDDATRQPPLRDIIV